MVISFLICPCCGQADKTLVCTSFNATEREVIDGILNCRECGSVFPIVDRLLDFVPPPLLDLAVLDSFEKQYAPELAKLGYERPFDAGNSAHQKFAAQVKQRVHFDNYAVGEVQRYDDYAKMPFWRATDEWTFERWRQLIAPGEMLLDVGCADGRSSFPHLPQSLVVGFDISRKMIRRAIDNAIAQGHEGQFSFFVSDGSSLPFRAASFRYVQTYGVLHHLPNPGAVAREIQRVLSPGGIHFASENNATVFRRLFDGLMKLLPIWYEEAGEQALISRRMVERWVSGLPVLIDSETVVFVPPHVLNLFSAKSARRILDFTNSLFGAIPGLKQNGGLIVFRIQKVGP